jgi:aminoglycoside 6'-N-acetyltransferase
VNVVFGPLRRAGFPLLARWLGAPHVAPWWREPPDEPTVEANHGPAVDGLDPTEYLLVELDGRPIGMVQRCRVSDSPEHQRALEPTGSPR